ncbi:hypothetical protein [Noviherbaspirillum soli]|uniref:hypothetical protein n=1 Tax=Noviherbaspirillum soli TaxID=1064518 RepID=UPI00188C870A|nr:hypothetical protein [Noviherbaspirillum soli]
MNNNSQTNHFVAEGGSERVGEAVAEKELAKTLFERAKTASEEDNAFCFSGNMTKQQIRARLDALAQLAETDVHA